MTQPDGEMWPMDDDDLLAARFEEHRAHLRAVAYRMLGSRVEAEDAVQETWLRLTRVDAATIDNLGGWLTTVVGRVCLNLLRSRRSRRDEPLGERVPDVVVTRDDGTGPEHDAVEADSVGLALLVVLDTLAPAERLAFVLHEMFAVPFDDIAPIVERTPAATRQLASRARRRMRGATPVPDSDVTRQRKVSTRSSRRRGRATSTPWWRCSTPTSCSARMAVPSSRRARAWSAGPRTSPGRRSCSPGPRGRWSRCWSTVPPVSSW
jgi:RNA polymerase sigma factor (sigma-70 family)